MVQKKGPKLDWDHRCTRMEPHPTVKMSRPSAPLRMSSTSRNLAVPQAINQRSTQDLLLFLRRWQQRLEPPPQRVKVRLAHRLLVPLRQGGRCCCRRRSRSRSTSSGGGSSGRRRISCCCCRGGATVKCHLLLLLPPPAAVHLTGSTSLGAAVVRLHVKHVKAATPASVGRDGSGGSQARGQKP